MVGIAFRQSGQLQQAGGLNPGLRPNLGYLEHAPGQGPGLVKDHSARLGQGLQVGTALHQDALGRSAADAPEKGQGDGDHQGAGTADDQKGQGAIDPHAPPGGAAQGQAAQRRHKSQDQRRQAHRRGINPGKPGDKGLGPGLFHGGVLHQVQNAGDGALAEGLGGAHPQKARQVDAAGQHLTARAHLPGQALAGEGGGVQGRSPLQHHAVQGHPFPGPHQDDAAGGHLVGRDRLFPLRRLQGGAVGADVHQGGDAAAAFAHGIALEQFAGLVKHHDGHGLLEIAQGHRAHGGHRHQEVFVKGVPAADAVDGPQQDVIARQQIGRQPQQGQGPGGVQQLQRQKQRRGPQDAVQHALLFFGHRSASFRTRGRAGRPPVKTRSRSPAPPFCRPSARRA